VCDQLKMARTLLKSKVSPYFADMTKRYALREDQWERIKDSLPGREETVGVSARDNRLFIEAVPLPRRHCLEGLARALWRLSRGVSAPLTLEQNWGVATSF
jgi:hypothetical protein